MNCSRSSGLVLTPSGGPAKPADDECREQSLHAVLVVDMCVFTHLLSAGPESEVLVRAAATSLEAVLSDLRDTDLLVKLLRGGDQ